MTNRELETAFKLYKKNLFDLCYKCTGNYHDSEDIVLSAYMEVCSRLEEIDFDKVEGFLIVAAKNKVIDLQRRQKRFRKIKNSMQFDRYTLPVDRFEGDRIISALEQLYPKMKEAVKLRHIHGYSRNQIAEIMGASRNTVRNNIAAGMSLLKKIVTR
jgi:RNA polymerase sigma-70 factor (ECF subfamily)